MDTASSHWLPLTEYALRSGMSISTLRRKIKSNSIEFKMEEGRYLIRSDDLLETSAPMGFASTDQAPRMPTSRPTAPMPMAATIAPARASAPTIPPPSAAQISTSEIASLREELRRMKEEDTLRWRALEARVSGIAKKLELFTEQLAETKMLVKIFEEKLDSRA